MERRSVSNKTQTAPSAVRNTKENLVHFFSYCPNFWGNLTDKFVDFNFIPRDYSNDIAVVLGLKSYTTKFALQLKLLLSISQTLYLGL